MNAQRGMCPKCRLFTLLNGKCVNTSCEYDMSEEPQPPVKSARQHIIERAVEKLKPPPTN